VLLAEEAEENLRAGIISKRRVEVALGDMREELPAVLRATEGAAGQLPSADPVGEGGGGSERGEGQGEGVPDL